MIFNKLKILSVFSFSMTASFLFALETYHPPALKLKTHSYPLQKIPQATLQDDINYSLEQTSPQERELASEKEAQSETTPPAQRLPSSVANGRTNKIAPEKLPPSPSPSSWKFGAKDP